MWILGMDIGGTKSAAVLGSGDGERVEVVCRREFPTEPERGWERTLSRLVEEATELMESRSLQASDIHGIGVSCGGPLDSRKGLVLGPPNLPGWDNVPVVRYFTDA